MNRYLKVAVGVACFVPVVGLFAFAAFAAASGQNPGLDPADAGSVAASAPAPAPRAGALTWAEASPRVLAGIEDLDARIEGQSWRFESYRKVQGEEIARRVGFDGQPPAQALETLMGALGRMAKAYEAMGPDARKEIAGMSGVQRVDALLACSPEEARVDAAVADLAARYQACVEKREKREIEEYQDQLVRLIVQQRAASSPLLKAAEGLKAARKAVVKPY
jgi:hypothetical protein